MTTIIVLLIIGMIIWSRRFITNKISQDPDIVECCTEAARHMEKKLYQCQWANISIHISKDMLKSPGEGIYMSWNGHRCNPKVVAKIIGKGVVTSLRRSLPPTDPTDGRRYRINYYIEPSHLSGSDYTVNISYTLK